MTASPKIIQNGTVNANNSVSKAQELPVRTTAICVMENGPGPKVDKGPELAEKLNEETKNKYVKGRPDRISDSRVIF